MAKASKLNPDQKYKVDSWYERPNGELDHNSVKTEYFATFRGAVEHLMKRAADVALGPTGAPGGYEIVELPEAVVERVAVRVQMTYGGWWRWCLVNLSGR